MISAETIAGVKVLPKPGVKQLDQNKTFGQVKQPMDSSILQMHLHLGQKDFIYTQVPCVNKYTYYTHHLCALVSLHVHVCA